MSKKHFVLIARVLKQWINNPGVVEVAKGLCDAFAMTNPLFNADTFLDACGVPKDAR